GAQHPNAVRAAPRQRAKLSDTLGAGFEGIVGKPHGIVSPNPFIPRLTSFRPCLFATRTSLLHAMQRRLLGRRCCLLPRCACRGAACCRVAARKTRRPTPPTDPSL